jgi:hypothetical protein
MPQYKNNLGIFWTKEYLENNPPTMTRGELENIELKDVDAWEIISETEKDGEIFLGVYAAYDPYAEFYMVVHDKKEKFFKGEFASEDIETYLKSLGIDFLINDKIVSKDLKSIKGASIGNS